jgi:nucleoid-associated protein YgaU
MSRTHVRRRLGAILVTLGVLASMAGTARSALGDGEHPALVADRGYVVRRGDTLWSIARRGGAADPRPVVDAIADANDLHGSTLVPGQRLLIPASA